MSIDWPAFMWRRDGRLLVFLFVVGFAWSVVACGGDCTEGRPLESGTYQTDACLQLPDSSEEDSALSVMTVTSAMKLEIDRESGRVVIEYDRLRDDGKAVRVRETWRIR